MDTTTKPTAVTKTTKPMAIDLLKLEKRFIDLFANVTQEEFEQWLLSKTESKPMAQQTAVEQLVNYMKENFHLTDEALEKFEEAKQMEKEQIFDAFVAGDERGTGEVPFNAEQYYTQTYSTRLQNETN